MAKYEILVVMAGLIASGSACSDDTDGGAATAAPGATSSSTGAGATGGAGTGGAGTGGAEGGAGGSVGCPHCPATGSEPLGHYSGTLCPDSQPIYDALVACACEACMTECADSWVCVPDGPMPGEACVPCTVASFRGACSTEASACTHDEN
jgi:hypothetical protein